MQPAPPSTASQPGPSRTTEKNDTANSARGLKRYTSLAKSIKQRAKADAEGRSYVGLHEPGSGTCKHALTQSITRMELNIEIPSRKEYRERKKALEGKKAKTIVALDLATHIPKKPKSTE